MTDLEDLVTNQTMTVRERERERNVTRIARWLVTPLSIKKQKEQFGIRQ